MSPVRPHPAQQLIHAATSPFAVTDIALHATTLPGYSPERGTFVRALLHIDARPLTFVDTEGGKRTASVDVLGMVFDEDGTEVAHLTTGFSMGLTSEAAGGGSWATASPTCCGYRSLAPAPTRSDLRCAISTRASLVLPANSSRSATWPGALSRSPESSSAARIRRTRRNRRCPTTSV